MRRDLPILIALLVLGCGDPLVSGTYRGRPLLTLSGAIDMPEGAEFLETVRCESGIWACFEGCTDDPSCDACVDDWARCVDTPAASAPTAFRLGIFWANDAGGPVVQQYSLTVSSFPARYNATLYAPPPTAVVRPAQRGRFALGLVMVYLDENRDEEFTPGIDPIVGGADGRAILYTPDGVDDERFGVLPAGYHRLSVLSVCTEGEGALIAQADSADMVLTLTADPELQRRLLLDPDCDGRFDDFVECGDPTTVERWCASESHLLCDLCYDVLFVDDGAFPE